MLTQQPQQPDFDDDPPILAIEGFLKKIDKIDNWEGKLSFIQGKLDCAVFYLLKRIPPRERSDVIKKIEPYVEKFYLTFKNISVRAYSIYPWLLEKKLDFCNEEEHRINLKKIESIYKEFSKLHPYDGWWFIRINYLCFSSKYLDSDSTIELGLSFLNPQMHTSLHKPSNKQLSQIMVVLSIEHEKKGLLKQFRDYAFEALHYDLYYAATYSLLGKYYNEQANNYFVLKKFVKGKYAKEQSNWYFEKARELDPNRFTRHHGAPPSSTTKIILCDLIQNTVHDNPFPKANLTQIKWPPLVSEAREKWRMEKIKNEFEKKFPLSKAKSINYETWEKENAEALAREEKRKYEIIYNIDSRKKSPSPHTDKQETTKALDSHSIFLSSKNLKANAAEFVPEKLRKS